MEMFLSRSVVAAGAVLAAVIFCASSAHSQARHDAPQARHDTRVVERERFHTDHWAFDQRFNHNHYYPQFGYAVHALPRGHVALTFRGEPFFFHSGVWYRRGGPGFVVVRPPIGIIVPILLPAYSTVVVGSVPYYYANDTYYEQAPGGYSVVSPPLGVAEAETAAPAPSPQAAALGNAPSAGATWYYCESSNTYYPYVSECKEGWHAVAATPPQVR
ncbi:MAG TPA: DUF6515 family protein [Burkholderiales bacterium]